MLKKGQKVRFNQETEFKDGDETITFLSFELELECVTDERDGHVLVKAPGMLARLQAQQLKQM